MNVPEMPNQLEHLGLIAVKSDVYPKMYYVYEVGNAVKLYGRVEVSNIGTFVVYYRTTCIGAEPKLERALDFLKGYGDAEQAREHKHQKGDPGCFTTSHLDET